MAARTTKTTEDPQVVGEDPKAQDVDAPESEAPLTVQERSERAPGLRTEAEVVAHAAAVAEVTGHVGTAAEHVTRVALVEVVESDDVHFTRADGAEFAAAPGTQAYRRMAESPEFTRD